MNEVAAIAPVRPAAAKGARAALREAVLAGAYFGRHHAAAAARLAADPEQCRAALDRDIAALDHLLGEQLDAILHDPRLRRFEGSWRGLAWLVGGLDPRDETVKVKVLNASWAELCRDLEGAVEFDQSQLFRKIYDAEF